MEKEVKFEVGKWYKNLSINSQKNTFGKFLDLRNNDKEFWMSEYIYNGKFHSIPGWLDYSSETIEIDIEEIQQYLPDEHPDKIKSNDFKVGDFIMALTPEKTLGCSLKKIVYKISNIHKEYCTVESVTSGNEIYFKDIRHATPEEINNHLVSIGQIPADEPLNTDSLKMILSIDDEELPMVSIIKTNTVKQLLNND